MLRLCDALAANDEGQKVYAYFENNEREMQ